MKKQLFCLLIFGLSTMFTWDLIAQDHSAKVMEKMNTFKWMEGNWQGEAWYIGPDRQKSFIIQHEEVLFRLDGAIVTMEGTGTNKEMDPEKSDSVFKAFGILTWDMNESSYVLRAYRGGNYIDSEMLPMEDGSFVWNIEMPYGKTRYTLHYTEEGHWIEKGEFSRDGGQNWMQTFEMNLERKP